MTEHKRLLIFAAARDRKRFGLGCIGPAAQCRGGPRR